MILATETEGLSRLFDLDFQLLADAVLMIIAMFFLFMFASHFLFNPVRDMLEKRKEKIKGELEQAATDQEEAAKVRALYEEKLHEVDKEAEAILADARKRGLENEAKIVAEAREEATRIIDRAKNEAELEKQKMADEVKREIIAVASLMAARVVQANIDTNAQHELIEKTLKEIGDSTWLS
ncbi:MAG: F0F1 ATP synthase subunit B [Lachnospiraceae bacterium]|nr:F0F1 ATP synthase subunit B [Lachnospiraceae bacterium]MBQ2407461.1 F0F1 ATP synthase subunit B [Lachnospiraceae bacterium]MEE0919760.1 F0F1 ATP synthase subunit B [Lachnospiraceae bacterium]